MNQQLFGFDPDKQWDYENGFYLTSHLSRIPKLLAHYELYKSICHLPGQIVECGVFKGASFIRLCTFREVLESPYSRQIIGFDAFGKFPAAKDPRDQAFVKDFVNAAGDGMSVTEMEAVLAHKGFSNCELVAGDINDTIPDYLEQHPELKISLLHIDVDIYEPTVVILKALYDRVVTGGLLVFDDYGIVDGETRAIDEFFADSGATIEKLPISHRPAYLRKT